jgi:hypothetical protein
LYSTAIFKTPIIMYRLKKKTYFIPFIFFCICLCLITSCETFGPATRYQNSRMLERPFYNGTDTSQFYASARLGNGRNYREKDKSFANELAVHKSWVSDFLYGSAGFYAQSGQYKLRDSSALNYFGVGVRGEGSLSFYSDNTEFNILTLSFSQSYENGEFFKLRKQVEQKKIVSPFLFNDSTNMLKPRSNWTTDLQSYFSLRHRFQPNKVLGMRAGLGFSFNNEMAIYGFLDASYQFDEHLNFNVNAAFPLLFQNENKNQLRLNNVFSVGFAYGF